MPSTTCINYSVFMYMQAYLFYSLKEQTKLWRFFPTSNNHLFSFYLSTYSSNLFVCVSSFHIPRMATQLLRWVKWATFRKICGNDIIIPKICLAVPAGYRSLSVFLSFSPHLSFFLPHLILPHENTGFWFLSYLVFFFYIINYRQGRNCTPLISVTGF